MTHSLHREGSVEALRGDFVMIARTSKVNKAETSPKLPQVAKIVFEVGPSNVGSSALRTNVPLGLDPEDFSQRIAGAHGFLCTFSSKEKMREVLRRVKEANLGISITVSGLIDEVVPMAQELGIKLHTINLSMGIIGKTELLAEPEVREMTTMCGHAMIAASLVKKGIADVASGARTPREASSMLGRPCVCGIYNLDRSDALLTAGAQGVEGDRAV
jgi:hypothetical protein